MSLLPKNEPKEFTKSPTKFFIWGESMTGKTFLARHFPNPILLNTDGNATKVDTPSINITSYKQLIEVLAELEKGNHTFETIIIDLVDDIETMLKQYICKLNNVEDITDLSFGKGSSKVESAWKNLMFSLAKFPYNVIFVSHFKVEMNNGNSKQVPGLSTKCLNICLGRCDVQVKCYKVQEKYIQDVISKRDKYVPEDIKDEQTRKLLNKIGIFN